MAIANALNANKIYSAIAQMAKAAPAVSPNEAIVPPAPVSPAGFSDLVRHQVNEVLESGAAAEAKQRDLMAGKADLIDVVTAVSETEVALETMVSVRDRVISAYEEIMRMPI